jgi:PKD repeat protein
MPNVRLFTAVVLLTGVVASSGCPPAPEGIPTAGFTADVRYGKAPLTVQFTDQSAPGDSPVTAWSWRFGDGGGSAGPNPSHTYTQTGTYDVSLTVTNAQGSHRRTQTAYIITGNVWVGYSGGTADDTGAGVCRTRDGKFVLLGNTASAGAGGSDIWLIKLDAQGEEVWNYTYGGAGDDLGYAIIEASDGDLVVAGSTRSSGAGQEDFYLLRVTEAGVLRWQKTFGTPNKDIAYDIVTTAEGGFLLVGETQNYPPDTADVYVVKTDAAGTALSGWPKVFKGSGRNVARAAYLTKDGGYVLAGYTTTPTSGVNNDIYVLRLTTDGTEVWTRTYGGFADDRAYDVLETSAGGILVCGTYATTTVTGIDMVLVELDDKGAVVRATTFGGAKREQGRAIIPVTGGYLLLGATATYGAGGDDFYLVKINATGESFWTRTFGGLGDDSPAGLVEGGAGFVLAGSTQSFGAGGADLYFIKTNADGFGPSEE